MYIESEFFFSFLSKTYNFLNKQHKENKHTSNKNFICSVTAFMFEVTEPEEQDV